MATYNICGLECPFFNIPHGVLENYKPTPRTYVFAFRCENETMRITLVMLLNSAWELQAIERPPFLVEDGERFVYLLENPHPTIFEFIERFAHWSCGAAVAYRCPYRFKKGLEVEKYYRASDDLIFTQTKLGTRPLLNHDTLSNSRPPIPDYYDTSHPPLRTAGD